MRVTGRLAPRTDGGNEPDWGALDSESESAGWGACCDWGNAGRGNKTSIRKPWRRVAPRLPQVFTATPILRFFCGEWFSLGETRPAESQPDQICSHGA